MFGYYYLIYKSCLHAKVKTASTKLLKMKYVALKIIISLSNLVTHQAYGHTETPSVKIMSTYSAEANWSTSGLTISERYLLTANTRSVVEWKKFMNFAMYTTFYPFWLVFFLKHCKIHKRQDTCAINDPLGQTHIHASSDHYSHLNFVLFWKILRKLWSLPAMTVGRPRGSKKGKFSEICLHILWCVRGAQIGTE